MFYQLSSKYSEFCHTQNFLYEVLMDKQMSYKKES